MAQSSSDLYHVLLLVFEALMHELIHKGFFIRFEFKEFSFIINLRSWKTVPTCFTVHLVEFLKKCKVHGAIGEQAC